MACPALFVSVACSSRHHCATESVAQGVLRDSRKDAGRKPPDRNGDTVEGTIRGLLCNGTPPSGRVLGRNTHKRCCELPASTAGTCNNGDLAETPSFPAPFALPKPVRIMSEHMPAKGATGSLPARASITCVDTGGQAASGTNTIQAISPPA